MNVPLIVPCYNQLTYLRNLINQFRFYYPENPIFIIDNGSTNENLSSNYHHDTFEFVWGAKVIKYSENNFIENLNNFIDNFIKGNYEYYVISDPDISIHPSTPGNFLEIFKSLIDSGYHRAGFNLITENIPEHLNNRANILHNEREFRNSTPVITVDGFNGYRAPIDTTFCMYTTKNSGWHAPMNGKDWSNCVRLFEAFHLTWHLPENVNEEMDFYFKTCKKHVLGEPSPGANNNSPAFYRGKVEYCTSGVLITPALAKGAILNEEFRGFKEDYLVLHCLLRQYNPQSVFEIGTNMGTGTKIIKNALIGSTVYSLDLPTELAHISLQHPINEGKGDSVGNKCNLPFTQLRGDSMKFNYADYPCEAYFIDGEHDYDHPHHETVEVLKLKPKLIIFHDSDIDCVYKAITDAFEGNDDYILTRVKDTRMFYAVRK